MYFVRAYIIYRDSISDPQGEAIKKAVHRMGCETIEDIRIGKYFEIQLAGTEEPVGTVIETICGKLPANVNMEAYRCGIEKIEEI